jgi:hypothetical protein
VSDPVLLDAEAYEPVQSGAFDPDEAEVRNPDPYDFAGAKRAQARASRDQAEAERQYAEAVERAAEAERQYRIAKAKAVIRERAEWPATVAVEQAAGDATVCDLRYVRDVLAGVAKAHEHALYRAAANRRAVDGLVKWSERVAPDGFREGR